MQAKVVHILSIVAALITSVCAAVFGAVGDLPERWQAPVVVGIGVLGVVATAITAAATALKSQALSIAAGQSDTIQS